MASPSAILGEQLAKRQYCPGPPVSGRDGALKEALGTPPPDFALITRAY